MKCHPKIMNYLTTCCINDFKDSSDFCNQPTVNFNTAKFADADTASNRKPVGD